MEGSPLGVPIDAQRLLTALVLADLAGMALARSDRRWPAVPAREQTGVEVLRATGAE
jgi:hypothetical protein